MPQNDKFIKDIYTLVSQNGFQGSEENALELLETNERFQQDVLKGIKAKGFNGELEDMLNLSGISLPEKKSPDQPLESSLEETSTDTTEESGAGEESFVDSSIDYVSNTVSALDRGFYKNFIGNPVKGLGTLLQGTSAKITGTDGKGVISDALIKLGTYINDTVDELAPQDEDFKNRVEERTGMTLESIPEGSEEDVIGGHIFCKRATHEGQEYVMGMGYPEQTPDGDEIYDQFVRVVLS